jgi:hypothetical protein
VPVVRRGNHHCVDVRSGKKFSEVFIYRATFERIGTSVLCVMFFYSLTGVVESPCVLYLMSSKKTSDWSETPAGPSQSFQL